MSIELSDAELKRSKDKFPTAVQGLRRVIANGELPNTPIEWLEVKFLASGEATYRYRLPRALDDDGGYIPPE